MLRRVMLFISSYIPLYVFLVVKNILERCASFSLRTLIAQLRNARFFDEINDYAITALLLLTIGSFAFLHRIISKRDSRHMYEILSLEDQTSNLFFSYISVYLLSCVGLSLNSVSDLFVFVFLMLLIGFIYIRNRMTYLNPVLQLMGYKIYQTTLRSQSTKEEFNTLVVLKRDLEVQTGDICFGSGSEDFVYITNVVEKQNESIN